MGRVCFNRWRFRINCTATTSKSNSYSRLPQWSSGQHVHEVASSIPGTSTLKINLRGLGLRIGKRNDILPLHPVNLLFSFFKSDLLLLNQVATQFPRRGCMDSTPYLTPLKKQEDIDKSQVMRVSRSNESLQIKVNNRELKEVDKFKYLGSVLTKDGYCTREIKMRIASDKEACC